MQFQPKQIFPRIFFCRKFCNFWVLLLIRTKRNFKISKSSGKFNFPSPHSSTIYPVILWVSLFTLWIHHKQFIASSRCLPFGTPAIFDSIVSVFWVDECNSYNAGGGWVWRSCAKERWTINKTEEVKKILNLIFYMLRRPCVSHSSWKIRLL